MFNPTRLTTLRSTVEDPGVTTDSKFQPYARMEDDDARGATGDVKRGADRLSVPMPSYAVSLGGLRARSRSPAGDRKAMP